MLNRTHKESVLDSTNHNEQQSITNLKDGENYRFLGILENTQQEDGKVLETTDFHKVTATNQYAYLPSPTLCGGRHGR